MKPSSQPRQKAGPSPEAAAHQPPFTQSASRAHGGIGTEARATPRHVSGTNRKFTRARGFGEDECYHPAPHPAALTLSNVQGVEFCPKKGAPISILHPPELLPNKSLSPEFCSIRHTFFSFDKKCLRESWD